MARQKGRLPCSIDGCERPSAGRGWCKMHWTRWRTHGSPTYERPTVEDRFWARVDKDGDGGCWLWTGGLFQGNGYGMLWVDGSPSLAHRVSYEMRHGTIPVGMQLDHLCRVRRCVNPTHLEAVTCRTNLLRGETAAARNVEKTHCPQGHPYDNENTRYMPNGARSCRECGRRKWREAHPPTGAKMGRPFADTCGRGHALSGSNLYVSPKSKRNCRACLLLRAQQRRQQKG